MKKILALILSLVMVFGLAACGASTEAPATTPPSPARPLAPTAPSSPLF